MTLNRFYFFFLSATVIVLNSINAATIIVPFENFLIEPSVSAGLVNGGAAGVFSALGSVVRLKNPVRELQEKYFNALNAIQKPQAHNCKVYWNGKEAPEYIYQLLLGATPNHVLLKEVKEKIKDRKYNIQERKTIKNLANITFDPKINSEVMQLNHDAVHLTNKLIKKGHRIIIADNYSGEAAAELRKKHDILRTTPMVVSGEIKTTISPEFYKKIFSQFNINPNDCILILTEEKYVPYAQQAGIPSSKIIVYKGHKATEKILKEQYHLAF